MRAKHIVVKVTNLRLRISSGTRAIENAESAVDKICGLGGLGLYDGGDAGIP